MGWCGPGVCEVMHHVSHTYLRSGHAMKKHSKHANKKPRTLDSRHKRPAHRSIVCCVVKPLSRASARGCCGVLRAQELFLKRKRKKRKCLTKQTKSLPGVNSDILCQGGVPSPLEYLTSQLIAMELQQSVSLKMKCAEFNEQISQLNDDIDKLEVGMEDMAIQESTSLFHDDELLDPSACHEDGTNQLDVSMNHHKEINYLPCDAVESNADGTWSPRERCGCFNNIDNVGCTEHGATALEGVCLLGLQCESLPGCGEQLCGEDKDLPKADDFDAQLNELHIYEGILDTATSRMNGIKGDMPEIKRCDSMETADVSLNNEGGSYKQYCVDLDSDLPSADADVLLDTPMGSTVCELGASGGSPLLRQCDHAPRHGADGASEVLHWGLCERQEGGQRQHGSAGQSDAPCSSQRDGLADGEAAGERLPGGNTQPSTPTDTDTCRLRISSYDTCPCPDSGNESESENGPLKKCPNDGNETENISQLRNETLQNLFGEQLFSSEIGACELTAAKGDDDDQSCELSETKKLRTIDAYTNYQSNVEYSESESALDIKISEAENILDACVEWLANQTASDNLMSQSFCGTLPFSVSRKRSIKLKSFIDDMSPRLDSPKKESIFMHLYTPPGSSGSLNEKSKTSSFSDVYTSSTPSFCHDLSMPPALKPSLPYEPILDWQIPSPKEPSNEGSDALDCLIGGSPKLSADHAWSGLDRPLHTCSPTNLGDNRCSHYDDGDDSDSSTLCGDETPQQEHAVCIDSSGGLGSSLSPRLTSHAATLCHPHSPLLPLLGPLHTVGWPRILSLSTASDVGIVVANNNTDDTWITGTGAVMPLMQANDPLRKTMLKQSSLEVPTSAPSSEHDITPGDTGKVRDLRTKKPSDRRVSPPSSVITTKQDLCGNVVPSMQQDSKDFTTSDSVHSPPRDTCGNPCWSQSGATWLPRPTVLWSPSSPLDNQGFLLSPSDDPTFYVRVFEAVAKCSPGFHSR